MHILGSVFFLANHALYEAWKNILEPNRPQMAILVWCMRIACCITKATHTDLEYVILIVFPLQLCLYDLALSSYCTYIPCLVVTCKFCRMLQHTKIVVTDGYYPNFYTFLSG
jgi:hypothetical protein